MAKAKVCKNTDGETILGARGLLSDVGEISVIHRGLSAFSTLFLRQAEGLGVNPFAGPFATWPMTREFSHRPVRHGRHGRCESLVANWKVGLLCWKICVVL